MTPTQERALLIQLAYNALPPQQQAWVDELAEGVISYVKDHSERTQMSYSAALEVVFMAGRVLNGDIRRN